MFRELLAPGYRDIHHLTPAMDCTVQWGPLRRGRRPMTETPRVVLLMIPFAGYDRGLLQGIARYTQLHGPWMICLSGDHPGVPIPRTESINDETIEVKLTSGFSHHAPFICSVSSASGIIGRINTPALARTLLSSGLPVIAIDLTEGRLADHNPLSQISEIRADSHNAGRLAADHLLKRRFTHFGYCGYEGRIWSNGSKRDSANVCGSGHHRQRPRAAATEDPVVAPRTVPGHRLAAVARQASGDHGLQRFAGHQVIESCLQAGFRVPDNVAVVGVDEDRLQCTWPTRLCRASP